MQRTFLDNSTNNTSKLNLLVEMHSQSVHFPLFSRDAALTALKRVWIIFTTEETCLV